MESHRKVIESILLVADEPVAAHLIAEVLEAPRSEVEATLEGLAASYLEEDRGFVLRQTADGWRLYTAPESAPWLERFVHTDTHVRLSGPALEVLAIVAYRQPVSRSQIAELRGVDSDGVVKTLHQRGLIEETGRDEGPGSPILFSVTSQLLERLGLRSLDELPALSSFIPDAEAVEEMEARLSPGV
jgi:segregation and condensation protein B